MSSTREGGRVARGSGRTAREPGRAWLVYDGECPLCSRYAQYANVERAVGELVLVDARRGGSLVDELMNSYDLDKGMVLKMDGRCYFGEDALRMLAALSGGRGAFDGHEDSLRHDGTRPRESSKRRRVFDALNGLFLFPAAAWLGYPLMRLGRRVILGLKGTGPIRPQSERRR